MGVLSCMPQFKLTKGSSQHSSEHKYMISLEPVFKHCNCQITRGQNGTSSRVRGLRRKIDSIQIAHNCDIA